MAKDTTPVEGEDTEAKDEGAKPAKAKKGPKGNLVPAALVAVGLLGGGFFFSKGGASASAEIPGAHAAAEVPAHVEEDGYVKVEAVPGAVASLEPITMNLADGRFLKLGLALQLTETAHAVEDEEFDGAKALDAAISYLGEHSYQQLAAPGGRAAAKEELGKRISLLYPGEVMGAYFTEFVMQ